MIELAHLGLLASALGLHLTSGIGLVGSFAVAFAFFPASDYQKRAPRPASRASAGVPC